MAPTSGRRGPAIGQALVTSVLVVLVVLVTVSCGIRPDDQPQQISSESLPRSLFDTETGTTDLTGVDARIYLVANQGDSTRLVPVTVTIDGNGDPTQLALQRLVTSMPPASDPSLTSPVSGATVAGLKRDGSTLEVDFGSLGVEGAALRQALAQIVFTATYDSDFDAVRFSLNGKPIAVPLFDRTLDPGSAVRPVDFPQLAPDKPSGTTTSSSPKR